MKRLQTLSLIVIIIALVSAGCKKFKTDDEIRENIVGTWVRTDCGWMDVDDDEIAASTLLIDTLVFHSGGVFDEFGRYDYCCSIDCDTAFPGSSHCIWEVENGVMTIIPDSIVGFLVYLNQPFPIRRLTNKTLVFDNVVIGNLERKKTCYCRD